MRRFFLCVALSLCASVSFSQNYQLHSVYIYSFVKYVQWPDQSGTEFTIGVIGDSPVTQYLKKMAAVKKAGDKAIIIKEIKSADQAQGLKVLFVPNGMSGIFTDILTELSGTNTLLITEGEGMGKAGSNINFIVRDGRLSFELNRAAMDRENLKVSSELTKLAILI